MARPLAQNQALFPAPDQSNTGALLTAHVDGGARGNPGPAGYGVVIEDQAGQIVARLKKYLGHQTNNYAEYMGLLAALHYCTEQGCKRLKVISDSELMVRQIKGRYKVSSPNLIDLFRQAKSLIQGLDYFAIDHVLRGKNKHADALANQAMDEAGRR